MLSTFSGDDFYEPLLRTFMKDLPTALAELKVFIKTTEFSKAIELSHQLSGSAATYGYPKLAQNFEKLEIILKSQDTTDNSISDQISNIEDTINKILTASNIH